MIYIWSSLVASLLSNDDVDIEVYQILLYFLADCGRETVKCFVSRDDSVGWQAMVTTSLNVERDQIETKRFLRLSSNE